MRPLTIRSVHRRRPPHHLARLVPVLLALTIVLGLLAACASAARSTSDQTPAASKGAPAQAEVARAGVAGGPLPAQAAPAAAPKAQAAGAPATTNQASTLPSLPPGAMLIRTASIEIEAATPLDVIASVRQIATSAASGADFGYVTDEQTRTSGSQITATITISVPAPTFASVMDQLRRLGTKVVSESSNSQDVTQQFVDVDAQLQALRATQAQLLQLLNKTQQLSDVLAVQRQLTEINTQINQLEGRENYLKSHSAFSTITATIHPPVPTTRPQTEWSPLATLLSALSGLGVFGQRVADFLIYLLVFGLPLVIVGGGAWLIGRRVLMSVGLLRGATRAVARPTAEE